MITFEWFKISVSNTTLPILFAFRFQKDEGLFRHEEVELIHHYFSESIDVAVVFSLIDAIVPYTVLKTYECFIYITESQSWLVTHNTGSIANVCTNAFRAQRFKAMPARWHYHCMCMLSPFTFQHFFIWSICQHRQFLLRNFWGMFKVMPKISKQLCRKLKVVIERRTWSLLDDSCGIDPPSCDLLPSLKPQLEVVVSPEWVSISWTGALLYSTLSCSLKEWILSTGIPCKQMIVFPIVFCREGKSCLQNLRSVCLSASELNRLWVPLYIIFFCPMSKHNEFFSWGQKILAISQWTVNL